MVGEITERMLHYLNPEVGKAPLYLNPNYRAKPQWLQNAICKVLDVLTGEAFSGRKVPW